MGRRRFTSGFKFEAWRIADNPRQLDSSVGNRTPIESTGKRQGNRSLQVTGLLLEAVR